MNSVTSRCRLNPPVPISQYAAEYTPVRADALACMQYQPANAGVKLPARKARAAKAATKEKD